MNLLIGIFIAIKDQIPELLKTYPKPLFFSAACLLSILIWNPNDIRGYLLESSGVKTESTQQTEWISNYVENQGYRLLKNGVYDPEQALELLEFVKTYKGDVEGYESTKMYDVEIGLRIKYRNALKG